MDPAVKAKLDLVDQVHEATKTIDNWAMGGDLGHRIGDKERDALRFLYVMAGIGASSLAHPLLDATGARFTEHLLQGGRRQRDPLPIVPAADKP